MVLSGKYALVLVAVAGLAACSSVPSDDARLAASPWAVTSPGPAHAGLWQHYRFPGKQATQFTSAREEGRHAVAAHAVSSASMLRHPLRIEPADLGRVQFAWKVPQLIAQADMAVRENDDSPVRVILVFEGDRAAFSAKNAMMSELVRVLTGEELPYATLMYVWDNQRAPGSVSAPLPVGSPFASVQRAAAMSASLISGASGDRPARRRSLRPTQASTTQSRSNARAA